jgi:hypothetical protein
MTERIPELQSASFVVMFLRGVERVKLAMTLAIELILNCDELMDRMM